MKFLLSSSQSVYDELTKTYSFQFSRHHSKQNELTISNTSFSTPTDLTLHPHCIFMRSNAITKLKQESNISELQGTTDENFSNVIAVLFETHTRGRYKQTEPTKITLHILHL